MKSAWKTPYERLRRGGELLDAVESGIKPVEGDPSIAHVGLGGAPNMLGELETDAAVMDGDTLNVGAVGALKGYASAVWVARQVMEVLPHTMIVGEGAARFAEERGAKKQKELPDEVVAKHREWLEKNLSKEVLAKWPDVPLAEYTWPKSDADSEKDTCIYLVRNENGQIAGGASTSGWDYKYPGRLGDSPIIGAGLYVDSEHGACACCNTGEMTMRAGTARSVITYMKMGASGEEACHEAIRDLRRLKGGYIGSVVIYAIDREGNPSVVTTRKKDTFWIWTGESDKIEERDAISEEL